MLLSSLRHPGLGFEVQQIIVRLEPDIDVLRLRDAWEFVVRRHAVLRSRFRWPGEPYPIQEVLQSVDLVFEIRTVDCLNDFLDSDRAHGVDLRVVPNFRLALIESPSEPPVLVFTFHHAILDGRSQHIVLEEAFRRYDEGVNYAPDPPAEFNQHCQAISSRDTTPEREYFTRVLDGVDVCSLPRSNRYWTTPSMRVEVSETVEMPADERPISGHPASLGSVIQAAWAVVLSKYCRTADVVFGVTRNGRHQVDSAAGMVGCLINSVPTRVRIDRCASLADLALQVHESGRAVRRYEQASLSEIQGWLRLDRPVFDTIIVYERYTLNSALRQLGGKFDARSFSIVQRSSFPIVLAAYQEGCQLNLCLEFDSTKWSVPYMAMFLRRFAAVLRRFLADSNERIGALDSLLPGEIDSIIAASGGALAPSGIKSLVGEAVNLIAHQRPLDVAYEDASGQRYSFAEVAERRDQMARAFHRLGVAGGSRVAVCANRSLDLVALQLATFGYGWILVPLEPAWPNARLDNVLSATQAKVLVFDSQTSSQIALLKQSGAVPQDVQLLSIDELSTGAVSSSADPKLIPLSTAAGEEPAYIMFTSGSSGTPKGVVVPHRALAAHARGAIQAYSLSKGDRVLQFSSMGFDVSLEEIVPTLLAGGTIVERTDQVATDVRVFLDFIGTRAVTVLNLPSAFFHELVLFLDEHGIALPSCVRLAVIGSERPTLWSVQTFLAQYPHVQLINAYGPTEATITSVTCNITELNNRGAALSDIPIGRPIGESRVFVLDETLNFCPIGVSGEICIAGPQIASGYLNAPELTATRFVSSTVDSTAKMYRTGDVGRLTEDGLFEFHGRLDEQVKVRGVRVEPAEVDQAIRSLPGVKDAAVVARDAGRGTELVAFVVGRTPEPLDTQQIKDALARVLPAAFVPSEFRLLEELPLRSSGKVNRRALALIAASSSGNRREIERPSGDLETWIFGVFSRILVREDIDVNDGFYDVGGHSLLAVRLLAELNRVVRRPLPLAAVLSVTSIRALARLIDEDAGVDLPPVIPLNGRAKALTSSNTASTVRGNDVVPLFCVCGVHLYANLARAMDPDRPVYGVYLPLEETLAAGKRVRLDIASLASSYISAVKAIRPNGPYVIGGVSFGGLLAYEMAQQLSRVGADVELLVLLDTILPRAYRFRGAVSRAKNWFRRTIEWAAGQHLGDMLGLVRSWTSAYSALDNSLPEDSNRVRLRDRAYRAAAENYDRTVEPYAGRTIIFRARRPRVGEWETVDWDLGWAALVAHDTPVFGIDGDHLGILLAPGASEIATVLRDRLRSS